MHSTDACPAGVGGAGSDCGSLSCQAVALALVKGGAGCGGFNNPLLSQVVAVWDIPGSGSPNVSYAMDDRT